MLYISLQASNGGLLGQLPFMAIMIAIIYFFFIRPSAKKQREQEAFITELKSGQEVVTSSGLIGRIAKIEDREVSINLNDKTTVRVTKGSISKELTAAFFQKSEK